MIKREDLLREDWKAVLDNAREEGREEARKEVREEVRKEKAQMTLKLLKMGLTPAQVVKGTGLSLEEVNQIQKDNNLPSA